MFRSASSIWDCTMPILYTSTIAREVKMQLLIMSSVFASSLVRNVSLWIKMRVATEGHCSLSLTTSLEWCFCRWRILRPISNWKPSSTLMVVASRSQVSQPYRGMGIIYAWRMLQSERVKASMKATDVTKSKEEFPGLTDILMDSMRGWQVVLPPDFQTFNSRVRLIRQLWASTRLVELLYQFLICLHNFSLTPMLYRCCNQIGCALNQRPFQCEIDIGRAVHHLAGGWWKSLE